MLRKSGLQVIMQLHRTYIFVRIRRLPSTYRVRKLSSSTPHSFKIIISIKSFQLNFISTHFPAYIIGSQSINIFPMWFLNLYPNFLLFQFKYLNMTNTHKLYSFTALSECNSCEKANISLENLSVLFAHAKSSSNAVTLFKHYIRILMCTWNYTFSQVNLLKSIKICFDSSEYNLAFK